MMELYIEGQPVDVSEVFSTAITYQVDDIKDFGSRNTNYSKTIILPGTARNNQLLGNVFEFNRSDIYNPTEDNIGSNFNAAKSARCIVFQDNIQVFKGVVRLLEIIIDNGVKEYEVAIFGELGGLTAAIGNKKLEDLVFENTADYDLNYTLTAITDSWLGGTSGDGIYYPLIDYGNYSTAKHNWDYKTFRPALYVYDYITRILNDTGYRYECDLFETARFKRQIVPYNGAVLTTLDDDICTLSESPAQVVTGGGSAAVLSTLSTAAFTPNGTNTQFTYAGTDAPALTVRLQGLATGTSSGALDIKKYDSGGSLIAQSALAQFTGGFDETVEPPFGIATGEKISLTVSFQSGSSVTLSDLILDIRSSVPVQVPLAIGNTFNIRDIIPKGILQRDFFSSILKLWNLYAYESDEERKVIIAPYIDFYDLNPLNALDWTSKLDRSGVIRIKPMSELNARYHEFKFKSDSDYYNDLYNKKYSETYGSRLYDSGYEFAGEKNTTEVIFSGTPLVGYAGEDKVYSTIFKKTGTTEEQINSNIRILQMKRITGVSSWDIKNGSTVLGSYTEYGYAGHLDDPDAPGNDNQFGAPKELFFTLASGDLTVNQFNVYWSPYMAEISHKDSKILTAKFHLTPRDINTLDFSKLVYLDGSLWRLNKIEDYNASQFETTACTLLKVIETVY